ncbi:cytokinin dehydrogenase 7 [Nymphaea colorata]|nr:cytokinin dehydrogenase 7 [Nymphaea colorata]
MLACIDRVPQMDNHEAEADPSPPPPNEVGGGGDVGLTLELDDGEDDEALENLRRMKLEGKIDFSAVACCGQASSDFGGMRRNRPLAVVAPATVEDVVRVVRCAESCRSLTVAARGNGHSINGQAQAEGGVVVEMSSLRRPAAGPVVSGGTVEVGGGELWEEVLMNCLERGVAPRSWTDYLGLTVGGTLSVGGVSGQSFKYGPQICNVAEVEVVTGKGEIKVCSMEESKDLFYGVLGGMGQFGIITRARVLVQTAPRMVRWVRLVYADFDEFSSDQESLIDSSVCDSLDYLEGFVFTNSDDPLNGCPTVPLAPHQTFDQKCLPEEAGPVLYCLELAFHFRESDDAASMEKRVGATVEGLRYRRALRFEWDVGYVEFLQRVKRKEEAARASGSWDSPHPWMNILVGKRNIREFDRKVFRDILRQGIDGPLLVYPLNKNKWDVRMSAALPEDEIFYLVALLRFIRPGGPSVDSMLAQNQEILHWCISENYDFKLYIPHYTAEEQWMSHFGKYWATFKNKKAMFDPKAILAPGQFIFSRKRFPTLLANTKIRE